MSATGNGTTQYLASAGTMSPVTTAYSWSCWYKPTHAPTNAATNRHAFALVDGTTNYDLGFIWDHSSSSAWKSAIHRNAAGGFVQAQMGITPGSGTWVHVAATWDGGTLTIYYAGVSVGTAAGASPSGAFNPNVSVLAWNSGAADFDNATIADLTIWNTTLTAAEVLSLTQGGDPTALHSGSVVFYDPLNTGVATVTGPALTNHSTTLDTTFFRGISGGLTLGGATTSTFAMTKTMSGGLTLGSGFVTSRTVRLSSSFSMTSRPNPPPGLRQTLGMTNHFRLTEPVGRVSSHLSLHSRFRSVVPGELINGRSMGVTSK